MVMGFNCYIITISYTFIFAPLKIILNLGFMTKTKGKKAEERRKTANKSITCLLVYLNIDAKSIFDHKLMKKFS